MSFFDWVLYVFIAICALMFMILVHEFGHYTAGKLLKFKINEFSVGFGKAIFQKKKKNGEVFSLRIFPLGGYCSFEGEDEDKPDNPGAFNSQPAWKRLIVLFMGAFFNFLSALIFSAILLMAFGYADRVQINSVEHLPTNIVSEEDWLKEGDVVLAVNGTYTNLVHDEYFTTLVADYDAGETFTVRVKRNGEEIDLTIYKDYWAEIAHTLDNTYGKLYSIDGAEYNYAITYNDTTQTYQVVKIVDGKIESEYALDANNQVTINNRTFSVVVDGDGENTQVSLQGAIIGVTTSNYKYGFFEALGQTFVFCGQWVWKILIILWQLISFQLDLSALGGTVTTIVTMAEATKANMANLLLLVPLISINLAVFNLLPFPALDGARMVFVGIEGIRGKPINRKVEGMIHFVGLIILLAFVLLVDILHFVT